MLGRAWHARSALRRLSSRRAPRANMTCYTYPLQAARTDVGFEAVATLYTRLSAAAAGLSVPQQAVAATTEATALALRASGAGAAEAASVVCQFSRALGSDAALALDGAWADNAASTPSHAHLRQDRHPPPGCLHPG